MAIDLTAELAAAETTHSRWQVWDFRKAQLLLWAGVLASIAASLNAAGVLQRPEWLSAAWVRGLATVVAALPAAGILIDKTFKHAARSAWHAVYAIRLRALTRSLRDRGASVEDVSKALDALELDMQSLFPPLDASVVGQKPSA